MIRLPNTVPIPAPDPATSHSGSSRSDELSSGVNVAAHSAGLEAPEGHLSEGQLRQDRGADLQEEERTYLTST